MKTADAFTFTKPAKILLESDVAGFCSVSGGSECYPYTSACSQNASALQNQRYKRSLMEEAVAAKIKMEKAQASKA